MGEYVNGGLLRIARQRIGLAQGEAAVRLIVPHEIAASARTSAAPVSANARACRSACRARMLRLLLIINSLCYG